MGVVLLRWLSLLRAIAALRIDGPVPGGRLRLVHGCEIAVNAQFMPSAGAGIVAATRSVRDLGRLQAGST